MEDVNKENPSYEKYIYVLQLTDDKYYVGSTSNIERRLQEHLGKISERSVSWTRRYKPIKLIKTFQQKTPYDEDNTTKEYMSKFGIENVRGGSYASPKLTRSQTNTLKSEIWHSMGACLRCGKHGHFIKNCKEEVPLDKSKKVTKGVRKIKKNWGPGKGVCSRCKRPGCFKKMCKAWKDKDGNVIKD